MRAVASFDVFDTVLTRAVGSPHSVFLLLGRKLATISMITCTPQAFAHARIHAEHRARENTGGREVTLGQIYVELGAGLGWDETQCARAMEAECALEAELIRPVPGARERVRQARARNEVVAFLSDMYLPAAFVQRQLERHELWLDGDLCYVSSDRGETKRTGELFRALVRTLGVPPSAVTHCGDDAEADVRAAERVGLQVQPLLEGGHTRYQQILESHAWDTDGLSSVMAGASRLARFSVHASSPRERALRDVAAGVVAPALTGFVLWILRRAEQLRLRRLYFVSRDGQILLDIARRLAPKLDIACELHYLYGGRQAWHLPALLDTDDRQLSWILDDTDFLSVRSMLFRVGIAPEEIRDRLRRFGFAEENWSRNLGHRDRQVLRRILQDEAVRELVLRKAAEARTLLVRYLRQEGLLDSSGYALVDVGWQGRAHESLATVLTGAGGSVPIALYFGLVGGAPDNPDVVREAYFFNKPLGIGFGNGIPGLIQMLEMFCQGDHGLVVGYCEDGDRIRAVFKTERNQGAIEWGLPIVTNTVHAFAESLLLSQDLIDISADVRPAVADVLKTFWLHPTLIEAIAWGTFPCEDDQGGTYQKPIAESFGWRDVVPALLAGTVRPRYRASWLAGSLELTPWSARSALKAVNHIVPVRRHLAATFRHAARASR